MIARAVRRLRERHARVSDDPQGGTTLMELVVGMVLMVICGSIFTGAVVALMRASNQTQAITDATSQTNRAFQTLDRTARFASAISTPGQGTSGSWYVEMRNTTTGSEVCTQLRVDATSRQLQSRTWSTSSPATSLTTWSPLASGITNGAVASGSTTQPFLLSTPGATANRQRLRVLLVATSGPANQPASTTSSFTMTAANSTQPPPSGAICQQGRP